MDNHKGGKRQTSASSFPRDLQKKKRGTLEIKTEIQTLPLLLLKIMGFIQRFLSLENPIWATN